MSIIKTICEENSTDFDREVQKHLDNGFTILNTFSGIHTYNGGSATYHIFTAIMLQDDDTQRINEGVKWIKETEPQEIGGNND